MLVAVSTVPTAEQLVGAGISAELLSSLSAPEKV